MVESSPTSAASTGHPPDPEEIFVSYAREDRAKALRLVRVLEKQGWDVWWDREALPGDEFERVISSKLKTTKCAIVLWSNHSINSRWVISEASTAADRGVLVPVLVEKCEIPLQFGTFHTSNLSRWNGHSAHPELNGLLKAVARRLDRPYDRLDREKPPTRWVLPAALLLALVVAVFGAVLPASSARVSLDLRASGASFQLADRAPLLSQPLSLAQLGASGLREIETPTTWDTEGADPVGVLEGSELALSVAESGAGFLHLDEFLLPDSSGVTVKSGEYSGEFRLILTGQGIVSRASVDGDVNVVVPPAFHVRHDFEPGRFRLHQAAEWIILDLLLPGDSAVTLASDIRISSLEFFNVAKFTEGDRVKDRPVSTLLSGSVSFIDLDRAGPTIEKGDWLRFEQLDGVLRDVTLTGDEVALKFSGTVSDMRLGPEEVTRSEMPRRWQVLVSRHAVIVALALLFYVAACYYAFRRWLRWA